MDTKSVFFSGLRTVVMVGLLSLAGGVTSVANAADGCGFGYHKSFYGGCIPNYRGNYYYRNSWIIPTPVYYTPVYYGGCWRNGWGRLRCPGYYYY